MSCGCRFIAIGLSISDAQGFDGPLPEKLEDLTLDSAQIVFRKVRFIPLLYNEAH